MATKTHLTLSASYLYNGGGTNNALQTDATGANVVASGADVIDVAGAKVLEVVLMSETPTDTGSILVSEFRGTPAVARCSRTTEKAVEADLASTVDRAMFGLTTGTERAPKRAHLFAVRPGSRVMLNMASVGTGPYYARFTLHKDASIRAQQLKVNADGELVINLETADIEIGAVELKDATATDRAKIGDASTARSATDHVLLVQQLDPAGKVPDWDKAAVPLAGETAEGATARSTISLLKRAVNKLIDVKGKLGATGQVLHPCNAPGGWERYNDASTPTLSMDHISGDAAIKWNKADGNYTYSAIYLDPAPEVDMGEFAADDYAAVTFKCPDISALDYADLLIGTNNTQFWAYKWDGCLVPDDKFVTLYRKLSDYDSTGTRVFPAEIKYFRFGLGTDSATDTITAIVLDRIAIVSAEAAYAATHGFAPTGQNALTAVETSDENWKAITLTVGATGAYWSLTGSSAYVVCQTATPSAAAIGAIFYPSIPYFWKTRGRTKIWIRRTATAEAKIHVTDEQ